MDAAANRITSLSHVESSRRHLALIKCPTCGVPLNLDQPDIELPNQLLGTCGGCHNWYQVDVTRRGRFCS
jgi:hypothetical protein